MLMIAGTHSGSGKTTVTMGLTRLLRQKKMKVQVYKTGPDYIDPMFHTMISGRPCVNLDPWFLTAEQLRDTFYRRAGDADLLLVEAAMGLCDGISGKGPRGSALEVAEALQLPVLLLADADRPEETARYLAGLPAGIVKGLLLNEGGERRTTPALPADGNARKPGGFPADGTGFGADAAADGQDGGSGKEQSGGGTEQIFCGIPLLGTLPALPGAALKSRHLGLTVPEDPEEAEIRAAVTAQALKKKIDLKLLLKIAEGEGSFRIAVAKDEAFSFFYEENLRCLQELGAEPVFFSPLRDRSLPAGVSGLWLPGGYPELYAEALSNNDAMLEEIRDAVRGGLPTVAECGGFLYLCEALESAAGETLPMCGVIPGKGYRTPKLQRFGYIGLTAEKDTLLLKQGETMKAHEFHYWDAECTGNSVHAEKANGSRSWDCVFGTPTLFAGFPHVYLPGSPAGGNLAAACRRFRDARGRNGGKEFL